jgi:hypothetical protein
MDFSEYVETGNTLAAKDTFNKMKELIEKGDWEDQIRKNDEPQMY